MAGLQERYGALGTCIKRSHKKLTIVKMDVHIYNNTSESRRYIKFAPVTSASAERTEQKEKKKEKSRRPKKNCQRDEK